MSQIIEIKVPDIGDYKTSRHRDLRQVGDTIAVEDTLVTLSNPTKPLWTYRPRTQVW